ncbi:MAG: SIMPL domain-containing protein [Bacteroidetes bacterium]|nr:SIMPL domain-containing protein [Bacteroidota bacterium]MBP6639904.1 SIMPL domain-containing protein [Bacteroidia bacterium]
MKQHLNSLIIALTAIIVCVIATQAYKNRNNKTETINVTGLGSKDFKSDLIVWSASFDVSNLDLKAASTTLDAHREIVRKFIGDQGVDSKELIFSAVDMSKQFHTWTDDKGNEHSEFQGYRLSQNVEVSSKDVEKVEKLSREVTQLINEGVEISSYPPAYYYTKLAELKIEMVAAATEDARTRAEKIAEKAGSSLGKLQNAQMGVFQIVAQNSNDDYGWGGSFDTSSKMKTANITMKLVFGID